MPHSVSLRNCRTAPITIGPRQMTGAFSPRKKPIEIELHAVLFDRVEILAAGRLAAARRRP